MHAALRSVLPLLLLALNPGCTCRPIAPPIAAPFSDDFNRATVGAGYLSTAESGDTYRIENGELAVKAAYNHPLWLTRPIPENAIVEVDCWSNDDAGDLKVEVWGDGKSFATDRVGQYTSTSYNFIFGGWHNQTSTLARMLEHGEDRQTRTLPRVVKGQRYHFTITRRGGHIDWMIDGAPFLAFDDPAPLVGDGHRFFSFNDWEAELHFDNLKITPL